MKHLFVLSVFCLLNNSPLVAENINLRFFNPQINGSQYCVTVQLIGQNNLLTIGSSTVFFTYNQLAIHQPVATSINFDATSCNGVSNIYGTNFSFLEVPNSDGEANYAIHLNTPNTACPEISTSEWVDVAEFCFDIVDTTQIADLTFNTQFTAFNTETDDGINQHTLTTITDGTTDELTTLNACNDGLLNGLEERIDCGGNHCYACATAEYMIENTNICSGNTIDFVNNSVNSDAWSWDFGGLATSNLENPSFTFDTIGTFTIQLTAGNDGHSDSFQQIITVEKSRKRVCKITWSINSPD